MLSVVVVSFNTRDLLRECLTSVSAHLGSLPHETLVVHGREDRVIPLQTSLTLADWIPNSQLHVFGHCGHWTQIEHAARFSQLVSNFLAEADNNPPTNLTP